MGQDIIYMWNYVGLEGDLIHEHFYPTAQRVLGTVLEMGYKGNVRGWEQKWWTFHEVFSKCLAPY